MVSALKSSTKLKFAGRKVNVELPALRPTVKLADPSTWAPPPRKLPERWKMIERLSDHREWTA
ncbi:MAG TPA: hypothetical protein VM910_24505 [Bradyrhizobium sp.]|nr:hypothetical protein [Bradyrhizobium sp.]